MRKPNTSLRDDEAPSIPMMQQNGNRLTRLTGCPTSWLTTSWLTINADLPVFFSNTG